MNGTWPGDTWEPRGPGVQAKRCGRHWARGSDRVAAQNDLHSYW